MKVFHPFFHSHLCFTEHIVKLYSSKPFYMEVRPMGFDLPHQFCKEFKVHFRVNTTYYMYFCYRLAIIAFYNVQHLVHSQFPAFIAMSVEAAIGTEVAGEYAYIGRLY